MPEYNGSNNKNEYSGAPFAAEIDFTIRLDRTEYSYWTFRARIYQVAADRLNFKLSADNVQNQRSPFEQYVRDRLKRLKQNEETFVFLTDYAEREGSFLITFSFFIFSAFMTYGSFRESLDYLRHDFNYFFKENFPVDTTIVVDYTERPSRIVQRMFDNISQVSMRIVNRQISRLRSIVGLIGMIALGFSLYATYKVENTPNNSMSEETIKRIIRTEVDQMNVEKTNEELLKLLQQIKNDSSKLKDIKGSH